MKSTKSVLIVVIIGIGVAGIWVYFNSSKANQLIQENTYDGVENTQNNTAGKQDDVSVDQEDSMMDDAKYNGSTIVSSRIVGERSDKEIIFELQDGETHKAFDQPNYWTVSHIQPIVSPNSRYAAFAVHPSNGDTAIHIYVFDAYQKKSFMVTANESSVFTSASMDAPTTDFSWNGNRLVVASETKGTYNSVSESQPWIVRKQN